jgi:hypothetical protein
MLIKTASIELARTKPNIALIAMHPGTVNSRLSQPFRGQQIGRPAHDACTDMLNVMSNIESKDTGNFYSYSGEKLPGSSRSLIFIGTLPTSVRAILNRVPILFP